jgi:hypothetical protein
VDVAQGRGHLEALGRQAVGTARQGLDGHAVAVGHREDRSKTRLEIAPMAGLDAGGEAMVGHAGSLSVRAQTFRPVRRMV